MYIRSKPLIFAVTDSDTLLISTLGKTSRSKMRSMLENGHFSRYVQTHDFAMTSSFGSVGLPQPLSETE